MKKKSGLIFMFLLCTFVLCFAQAGAMTAAEKSADDKQSLRGILSAFLEESTVSALLQEQKLVLYKYRKRDMKRELSPSTDVVKRLLLKAEKKSAFLIEQLYLHKKTGTKAVDASKILRSISALSGLQYYSHSRKEMRTLYKQSFAVRRTDSNKVERIDDPVEGSANGLIILAQQEDLTFGNYLYRYEYITDGNDVGVVCENDEALKYSVFKVIAPHNLKILLAVHDLGEYLLVYGSTSADFSKLPGLEKKLKNSFSARMEALYGWFIKQYTDMENK